MTREQYRLRNLLGCLLLLVLGCKEDAPPVPSEVDAGLIADAYVTDANVIDVGFQPDANDNVRDAGVLEPDASQRIDAGQYVYETIVLLDGVPASDTVVLQGGTEVLHRTDSEGRVFIPVDWSMEGDIWILASHPKARIWGAYLSDQDSVEVPVQIELQAYDESDNPNYIFSSPGEPEDRPSTAECGHCHQTINDAWFDSPHRTTASNPKLQDIYRGSSHALSTEAQCLQKGGRWLRGQLPGQSSSEFQCYLNESVLSELNSACVSPPCDNNLTEFGACADCHAPGINGQLGGRDLRDAQGVAYKYGVHCDVCHRTEEVQLSEAPGVAGRLKFMRPSEKASVALGGGGFLPMTFGPSHDSPNPRMGSVQRDHFRESSFCAGCHEQYQEALIPGQTIDRTRWPSGKLPIHTTYGEWLAGPLSPGAPCQSCHMPPDPSVSNGGDLQRYPFAIIGLQGGYVRAPGTVRKHSWVGPRTPQSQVLELAAGIFVEKSNRQGTLTATVTVKNVGCGHALPTGEPMRSVLLLVEAYCETTKLVSSGGDVVPHFGGFAQKKNFGEDWTQWNGAQVGDVIRVIRRSGGYYDYEGYEDFGNGRFTPEQKGMPRETFVAQAEVTSVFSSSVALSRSLPAGDVAYLVPRNARAGHPGFGFARVTADVNGQTMVPHYQAVDIVSDNRLLPQKSWSSTHEFVSTCDQPVIKARLVHRDYSYEVAQKRSWTITESLMTEVQR